MCRLNLAYMYERFSPEMTELCRTCFPHVLSAAEAGDLMAADELGDMYPVSYTHLALAVKEFTLGKGEKTALTGPSGSGKTTFLHCLSALLSPTSGTISVDGKNMDLSLIHIS